MNEHKCIMTVLMWIVCLVFTACSNDTGVKFRADKNIADNSSTESQHINSTITGSLTMQKNELAKIYTQAIAEFIKVAYKKDKTSFDTLFFGKHVYVQPDDFPDINLPEIIESAYVMLVNPEVAQKKQQESKSMVYVNMMGWVEKEDAEFLFVVFSKGAEHQYDYFINFTYNTSRNKFELEKIEFENYLQNQEQKTKRITIYKGGKYVWDK